MYIFNTTGFRNVNNNCFLNCLLISMFGYEKSPFFKMNHINGNKMIVFNYIMELIRNLKDDKKPDATYLRNIFPNEIKYGQQDTSETFDFFMKYFDFQPICIQYKKIYKTEDGNEKKIIEKQQNVSYINVDNDNSDFNIIEKLFAPSWIDLGEHSNWIHDDNNKPTFKFMKTKIYKLEGETLVFSINRADNFGRKLTNRIICPKNLKISNKTYFRFAMILHNNSNNDINYGHYNVILSDRNGNDYIYDDNKQSKIHSNKVHSNNREYIERNCTLVFYFMINS